ncbi:AAA family ATPase [Paenibacillus sp. GCM10027627]|uniref:AAA family ATPase n=1 Tax=unclassified Paenibacillus TaxID=185978 RepID=UPI00363ED179
MRPLKLTMKAFGPYRDVESIDFGTLGSRGLFVISGNTGAGKTSIFDAICYALYGTASGEDRFDIRMLRSQFADENDHTSVELDFAVGGRQYRVFRQMKHRKGNNRSETGEKAELFELDGEKVIPAVDRFMTTEVNAKLLSIIGLTKEQFSQIVMLPQGEFRKLLTSDTDNKEDILRKIFRTELYEKLEERFQRRNRELQDRLKEARAAAAAVMRQAEEALPRREEGLLASTFRQEVYSASQVTASLSQEADFYKKQMEDAGTVKAKASLELDAAQEQLREIQSLNAKHDELETGKKQRERYAEQEGHIVRQEKRLELAVKASGILPYEEQWREALRNKRAKENAWIELEERRKAAEQAYAEAMIKHREEAEKEDIRREAERELVRLQELVPGVSSLESQRGTALQLEHSAKAALKRLAALDQNIAELKSKRLELQAEIKLTENAALHLHEKRDRLKGVEQQGKTIKRLLELTEEAERLAHWERERELAFKQAAAEQEKWERLWLEGQASLLAAHLQDGMPCPVCGSESHPDKAHASSEEAPSKEKLQEAKNVFSHVQHELMTAKAQAASALTSQAVMLQELEEAGFQHEGGENGSGLKERLQQRQTELRVMWRDLKDAADHLQRSAERHAELKNVLEHTEKELDSEEKEADMARREGQRLEVERTAANSALQKELERIPEPLRSPDALKRTINERQTAFQALEQVWKAVQERLQQTSSKAAESRAYAEQAMEGRSEAEGLEQRSMARYEQELAKAGFAAAETYQEALISDEESKRMKDVIVAYRTEWGVLIEKIASLELELKGMDRRSAEPVLVTIAEWKAQYEAALDSEGSSRRFAEEATRLADSVHKSGALMVKLEEELEGVLDLYSMLKGDNELKMSFERYILIEYLEQILTMANVRLRDISNGQFRLERSDRLESRGKQSGLGLDVYDAYTGQNRDVKSLSGGEKFNASLCLALGMTDVIQAHQGGVSIEMMLIDEGFGSLDEESLHKAVSALIDLQKAGRMIGVISHVGELKDSFPACLSVSKTKAGYSRTEIILKN